MALAYVGTPTTASMHGATSVTVSKPSGVASGNLLLIFVAGTDHSTVSSNPSGFGAPLKTSSQVGCMLYGKVAGGSEPSSYTTGFSSGQIVAATCIAISGQATTWNDPSPLPAIYDPGFLTTSDAVPGVTLAGASDWLLGFFGFGQSAAPGTFSLPAGFTQRVAQFNTGAANSDCGLIVGDVQSIAAGATGTKTATTTGSNNFPYGFIVGITPGTAGQSIAGPAATAAAMAPVGAIAQTPAQPKLFPLSIKTELLINGTWNDISSLTYQRNPITITGGQTERGDTVQAASLTMTVNNRDGRFTPNYVGGVYYPYLQQNVQLRVSVTATSASGNFYTGYRFWGRVSAWPPLNDISGHDVYVNLTASGVLRQLNKGGGQGSALARYYAGLSGANAPVAYWPCEEDVETNVIGSGVQGGTQMAITVGKPTWKAVSNFNGSAPLGVLNGSTWDGQTGSFGSSGNDVFNTPGTFQWVATTSTVVATVVGAGGGGDNGFNQCAGGGGELAQEASLAVTPGNSYTVVVGAGGPGGALQSTFGSALNGTAGGSSSITGDAVTVTGNGGGGGGTSTGGTGGTGSANTVHHNGGAGGAFNTGAGGSGGGSSGGTLANGNVGGTTSTNTGANGGAAPAGGGAGGRGGNGGFGVDQAGFSGGTPGGGGGGGGRNTNNGAAHSGGTGGPGQVQLVYTPQTVPTNNVIRFLVFVPAHGGNNGAVLVRALTSGTVARLDVTYVTGGKLRLQGFNNVSAQIFDSGAQSFSADNRALMVSVELAPSGGNVAWAFSAIQPGAPGVVAKFSGTVTTAVMGNVSEVLVAPSADVTKTAIGHVSVQYALIPLWKVSQAINGNVTELSIDRFIRLANEQALANIVEYKETFDHWGFETGTQSWTAAGASLTQSAVTAPGWPTEGTHSLLLTAAGSGTAFASSPSGTAGQQVSPGDLVSAAADVYSTTALAAVQLSINWFNSTGSPLTPGAAGVSRSTSGGDVVTVQAAGVAPAGAATCNITVGDGEVLGAGILIYVDHVRVSPQMGPQSAKAYRAFLEEIQVLDQGILKEAKNLFGLKYRTRLALINQTPSVTLDYAQSMISPPLAPVIDDKTVVNNITVSRVKGSKVTVSLINGVLSTQEPPLGVGQYKKNIEAVAADDAQLLALASHLLNLGTVTNERYPTITVNLARCGIKSNALAPLMSVVAGVEVGDFVQIVNLPFWFPSQTAKQLVIGYTEVLSAYTWTITWNCVAESPWEISTGALRRW